MNAGVGLTTGWPGGGNSCSLQEAWSSRGSDRPPQQLSLVSCCASCVAPPLGCVPRPCAHAPHHAHFCSLQHRGCDGPESLSSAQVAWLLSRMRSRPPQDSSCLTLVQLPLVVTAGRREWGGQGLACLWLLGCPAGTRELTHQGTARSADAPDVDAGRLGLAAWCSGLGKERPGEREPVSLVLPLLFFQQKE